MSFCRDPAPPVLYDNFMFNFLRHWRTTFQKDCTISHVTSNIRTMASNPMDTCYFVCFLAAIAVGVRWYLIVFSLCISLLTL